MANQLQENEVLQREEVEALSVIYNNDYEIEVDNNKLFKITLTDAGKQKFIQLEVTFSPEYPLLGPPVYAISAPWLSRRQKCELCNELEHIYSEHCGESVLFMWTEKIREFLQSVKEESVLPDENCDVLKNELCIALSAANSRPAVDNKIKEEILIHHGNPVTDRRSTFQAHVAAVKSVDEVKEVTRKLLENKKIASATHNISAYRIFVEPKNSYLQDCDDDGEVHAGSRLLHLLQILNAKNVVVVVSRWYGGIQLGPDRFKHINNVARSLLNDTGYIVDQKGSSDNSGTTKSKKRVK